MAGYLSKTASIQRVDLEGGYHAMIHKLRKADGDALSAVLLGGKTMRGKIVAADDEETSRTEFAEQDMDSTAYTTQTLLRGIESWDLDDEDGAVLPLTAATIDLLTREDSATLLKAIRALSEPPTKVEKKD